MRPFTPIPGATVSVSASSSSANVKLGGQPISGEFQVRVRNAGSASIFVKFGPDLALAATTDDLPVPPEAVEVFTISNRDSDGAWYMAVITASGTATVQATSGQGEVYGYRGDGSGGGGTSDTTEATQLLVKAAAETVASAVKTEDLAHGSGDKGMMTLAVRTDTASARAGTDGDYIPLITDASGQLWVRIGAMAPLPAGTNNIGDVDVLSLPALPAGSNSIGTVVPAGNVASGAADTGNPIKIGGVASSAAPSAVDNGDRVDQAYTQRGGAHVSWRRADGTEVNPDEPVSVVGPGDKVQLTPTVTSGAYSANDVIGGKLTFANMARVSGGAGWLQCVNIGCKAAVTPQLELWLFDADPTNTTVADNAVWSLNAADLGKVIGVVDVVTGDWKDGGTPNFVSKEYVRKYELAATSMYGYLVDRTGTTLTSTSDIIITLEAAFD